jgi:hypothetical protein
MANEKAGSGTLPSNTRVKAAAGGYTSLGAPQRYRVETRCMPTFVPSILEWFFGRILNVHELDAATSVFVSRRSNGDNETKSYSFEAANTSI